MLRTFGLLPIVLLLATTVATAQENQGFYLGITAGTTFGLQRALRHYSEGSPTRCDPHVYGSGEEPPAGDPGCTTSAYGLSATFPMPAVGGFTTAPAVGYDFGRLRVEFDYRARTQGEMSATRITAERSDPARARRGETSTIYPPNASISSFRAHQLFGNVLFDFENSSRWTPSAGVGFGVAMTGSRLREIYIRKTLNQGFQDVVPPLTMADRPAGAAGTASIVDQDIGGSLSGMQVLGGIDYALTDRVSVGGGAHYARFEQLDQGIVWALARSHESVRPLDGASPWPGDIEVDGPNYWALTLSMKYRF